MGILDNPQYETVATPFNPGDLVMLYTDGITDAMNCDDMVFGKARLASILGPPQNDAVKFVSTLIESVDEFSGPRGQRDDICVLACRRKSEKPD